MTERNNLERLQSDEDQTHGSGQAGAENKAGLNIGGQGGQSNGLTFVVPEELVDLPSKGLLYKKGHPLKNKDVLSIKQMTTKEEDILTNQNFLKKGIAIDRMLESIILDKSLKVDELLICDKNALVMNARISGYGSDYESLLICPKCRRENKK